jgi:hypothetical protein
MRIKKGLCKGKYSQPSASIGSTTVDLTNHALKSFQRSVSVLIMYRIFSLPLFTKQYSRTTTQNIVIFSATTKHFS